MTLEPHPSQCTGIGRWACLACGITRLQAPTNKNEIRQILTGLSFNLLTWKQPCLGLWSWVCGNSAANISRMWLRWPGRSQRARDIEVSLVQWWGSVVDAGPTLNQQWLNVSCLDGSETDRCNLCALGWSLNSSANTRRGAIVYAMLVQRLRRWPYIKSSTVSTCHVCRVDFYFSMVLSAYHSIFCGSNNKTWWTCESSLRMVTVYKTNEWPWSRDVVVYITVGQWPGVESPSVNIILILV